MNMSTKKQAHTFCIDLLQITQDLYENHGPIKEKMYY